MSMGVRATAPGKLMLLGEYAVLEGAPALVVAVDRRARVEVGPAPGPQHRLRAPDLGLEDWPFTVEEGRVVPAAAAPPGVAERLRLFERVVEVVAQTGGGALDVRPSTALALDTSAFRDPATGAKLGLGSSAALAVALVGALRSWWGSGARAPQEGPTAPEAIFALALRAHRAAQGERGSGFDVAAALWGGLRRYRAPAQGAVQPAEQTPLPWPAGLGLGVIFTGQSADTTALTARVAAARRAQPAAYRRIIHRLADGVEQGATALASGAYGAFADAVGAYHDDLVVLGDLAGVALVTLAHAQLSARARAEGLAYKPSGAGGGDIGILLGVEDRVAAFLAALPADLGTVIPLAPAAPGLEIALLA